MELRLKVSSRALRWIGLGLAVSLAVGGLRVAGALDTTPSSFTPVVPVRLFDTRADQPPLSHPEVPKVALGPGGQLHVTVGGLNGVPADAKGVVLNVAVISGSATSWLTVWPSGDAKPNTANVNWSSAGPTSNSVNVGLGTSGKVSLFNAVGTVHVIVDLLGYYTAAPGSAGGSAALLGEQTATSFDTVGHVESFISITVGADGMPIISHQDTGAADLRVTHCDNVACTSATSTSIDTANNVGGYSSITIGTDGLPIISHYDGTTGDLRVTHCTDVACTSATSTSIDTANNVGRYSSITIGADGLAIISHQALTAETDDLRVSHCENVACTSATSTSVDTGGFVGYVTSITIGADGLPIVSHQGGASDLRVSHCENVACTSATSTNVDTAGVVGYYSSITIGADGLPIISHQDYTNGDLRVSHCESVACTSAASTGIDTANAVGYYSSITIGADGLAIVSHTDGTNGDLRVSHCANVACTSATSTSIDTADDVGYNGSITIGADGLAIISHYDNTNGDLRVSHCGNLVCSPFIRPGRH